MRKNPFVEGVIPRRDGCRFHRLPLPSRGVLDELFRLAAENHPEIYRLHVLEMFFRVRPARYDDFPCRPFPFRFRHSAGTACRADADALVCPLFPPRHVDAKPDVVAVSFLLYISVLTRPTSHGLSPSSLVRCRSRKNSRQRAVRQWPNRAEDFARVFWTATGHASTHGPNS